MWIFQIIYASVEYAWVICLCMIYICLCEICLCEICLWVMKVISLRVIMTSVWEIGQKSVRVVRPSPDLTLRLERMLERRFHLTLYWSAGILSVAAEYVDILQHMALSRSINRDTCSKKSSNTHAVKNTYSTLFQQRSQVMQSKSTKEHEIALLAHTNSVEYINITQYRNGKTGEVCKAGWHTYPDGFGAAVYSHISAAVQWTYGVERK